MKSVPEGKRKNTPSVLTNVDGFLALLSDEQVRTSYKKRSSRRPHIFLHIVQGVAQNKSKVIVAEISYEFQFIILRARPAGLSVVKLKLRNIIMFVIVDMGAVFTCSLYTFLWSNCILNFDSLPPVGRDLLPSIRNLILELSTTATFVCVLEIISVTNV